MNSRDLHIEERIKALAKEEIKDASYIERFREYFSDAEAKNIFELIFLEYKMIFHLIKFDSLNEFDCLLSINDTDRYFKNSKDIYESFKEDTLYLEIRFGIFTGIAKYFKMNNFDIKIIGFKTIDYDSDIVDIDLFDEIVNESVEFEENSLIIKI